MRKCWRAHFTCEKWLRCWVCFYLDRIAYQRKLGIESSHLSEILSDCQSSRFSESQNSSRVENGFGMIRGEDEVGGKEELCQSSDATKVICWNDASTRFEYFPKYDTARVELFMLLLFHSFFLSLSQSFQGGKSRKGWSSSITFLREGWKISWRFSNPEALLHETLMMLKKVTPQLS